METGKGAPPTPDAIRAAEVRQQLERILSDAAFSGANRRSRLLRYLVEQALDDHPESLKESIIATEVFDRSPDYDPQIDSVVRVEVGRLRDRLDKYYAKAGPEPVRIQKSRESGYRHTGICVSHEGAVDSVVVAPPPAEPRSRKPLAAGVAIAVIFALLGLWAAWRMRAPVVSAPPTIAVLPFLNLSGDAADEYLGEGISEELTETLAEFSDLRVVARTSAFQYKGKSVDVREIGRNLRAAAVIEGSVVRRGDQFRVIAQLIRSSDGYHLWSHTYETTLAELPAVESGIARAARENLAPSAAAKGVYTTRSPEAHDLYMRAVYELNLRTEASTRQSIELARQATERDPSFAQPYVVMAADESQLNTLLAQSPHAGAERAWADIAKALALDPQSSGAHAQKAILAYTDQWDWPQAEREFRLALSTGSHGSAENLYGWSLMTRGRFDEARKHLQIAAELDPLSLGPQLNQVSELMNEQKYPEASRKAEQILRTAPKNFVALYLSSSIAFWQHDCPAATEASRKMMEAYPDAYASRIAAQAADAACGRPVESKGDVAAEILRKNPSAYISPYSVAGAYAIRKDTEHAISYLQKSAELREPVLMVLKVDRAFDSLRQDPRFIALERKLGLLE